MNTTSNMIALEAAGLEPGGSMRMVCPACGGGSKKAQTLSVRRQPSGALRWRCWRDRCPTWGADDRVNLVRTRKAGPKPNPYTGEIQLLSPKGYELLSEAVGWREYHFAVGRPRWAPEAKRVAFPIFDPVGARRGFVLRSYHGSVPKAINYRDKVEPCSSWYGEGEVTVVVEDIPSAVRASRYTRAVALCGTSVSVDARNELAANTRHVVWALDADALGTAVKNNRQNQLIFNTSRVLPLTKDLKDMPEDELATLMKGLTNV